MFGFETELDFFKPTLITAIYLSIILLFPEKFIRRSFYFYASERARYILKNHKKFCLSCETMFVVSFTGIIVVITVQTAESTTKRWNKIFLINKTGDGRRKD